MRLIDRLVDWWMRRCPHDDADVMADYLEGGGYKSGVEVKLCRRCGAVRTQSDIGMTTEWRRPRPLWCEG